MRRIQEEYKKLFREIEGNSKTSVTFTSSVVNKPHISIPRPHSTTSHSSRASSVRSERSAHSSIVKEQPDHLSNKHTSRDMSTRLSDVEYSDDFESCSQSSKSVSVKTELSDNENAHPENGDPSVIDSLKEPSDTEVKHSTDIELDQVSEHDTSRNKTEEPVAESEQSNDSVGELSGDNDEITADSNQEDVKSVMSEPPEEVKSVTSDQHEEVKSVTSDKQAEVITVTSAQPEEVKSETSDKHDDGEEGPLPEQTNIDSHKPNHTSIWEVTDLPGTLETITGLNENLACKFIG